MSTRSVTVVAIVAQATPLEVHFPGDQDGVNVPADNLSGFTVNVGASVRVVVAPGGDIPQVIGPA